MNALIELMEEEEILDENITEFLKEDLALAGRDLGDVATLRGSQVNLNQFKYNPKSGQKLKGLSGSKISTPEYWIHPKSKQWTCSDFEWFTVVYLCFYFYSMQHKFAPPG